MFYLSTEHLCNIENNRWISDLMVISATLIKNHYFLSSADQSCEHWASSSLRKRWRVWRHRCSLIQGTSHLTSSWPFTTIAPVQFSHTGIHSNLFQWTFSILRNQDMEQNKVAESQSWKLLKNVFFLSWKRNQQRVNVFIEKTDGQRVLSDAMTWKTIFAFQCFSKINLRFSFDWINHKMWQFSRHDDLKFAILRNGVVIF